MTLKEKMIAEFEDALRHSNRDVALNYLDGLRLIVSATEYEELKVRWRGR